MLSMNNNNIKSTADITAKPAAKKKKHQRIRNRRRNKCNRLKTLENCEILQQNSSGSSSIAENISAEKGTSSIIKVESPKLASGIMETNKNTAGVASKTREDIMAEREAKKLAKQAKKMKVTPEVDNPANVSTNVIENPIKIVTPHSDCATEKSQEHIKDEREAKKLTKRAAKAAKVSGTDKDMNEITKELTNFHISSKCEPATSVPTSRGPEVTKKPTLTKAERRAIQETQRAAKAQALNPKKTAAKQSNEFVKPAEKPTSIVKIISDNEKQISPIKSAMATTKTGHCNVKLFNHLQSAWRDVSVFVNNSQIHPSIIRLGEQYARRTVVGSNARCLAFMNALKMVIQDFETPAKKEFTRSLEASIKIAVDHLQKCRPLAVSVSNAHKHISKHVLTQLPTDKPESELKENLCHFIDCYIENQIGKAAQAISSSMQEKIMNGDVILTFGCSSLINYICEEAHRRHVDFRVIVVDSRPFCEGQELLRRLTSKEIPCTYVLINAVGFVMPEATKVLLGAHALLSNGYVMARTGTAQVALVANSFNVPVLVCCETHKFSERFQTDAIVYNELGDPHDLVLSKKCCLTNWQAKSKMSPLNLIYDITPPELVTAVVTEVSILPCTSVPVILRIKPTEIGYYS